VRTVQVVHCNVGELMAQNLLYEGFRSFRQSRVQPDDVSLRKSAPEGDAKATREFDRDALFEARHSPDLGPVANPSPQ
jgi:hypothetical protein